MVILVVFNSFNVVKNLKKPEAVARQKPPFYTTHICLNEMILGKVPISNFCGILSNFYAENRFFILFQSVEVIALQNVFSRFLHCERIFEFSLHI